MPFNIGRMYSADWPEHTGTGSGRGTGNRVTPGQWQVVLKPNGQPLEYATWQDAFNAIQQDIAAEKVAQVAEETHAKGYSFKQWTKLREEDNPPGVVMSEFLVQDDGQHTVEWQGRTV